MEIKVEHTLEPSNNSVYSLVFVQLSVLYDRPQSCNPEFQIIYGEKAYTHYFSAGVVQHFELKCTSTYLIIDQKA
jgi:hypothetical protein